MTKTLGENMYVKRRSVRACTAATVVVAVAVAGLGLPAEGYSYESCNGTAVKDKSENLRYGAATTGFPAGHPDREALIRAGDRWNRAPGDFQFLLPSFNDDYHSRGNTADEIWFSNKEKFLDGSPARSHTVSTCALGIVEADIVFKASLPWSFSDTRSVKSYYGGSSPDWNTTALHEMGHSLGLKHENREYNIMGIDGSHTHASGSEVRANVGEDAGDGEMKLYGVRDGNTRDVGVSHWKYGGKDNEYSRHELTLMYNKSTKAIQPWDGFEGVRRFHVNRGSSYDVEFTYENNGSATTNGITLGFYISTDRPISSLDRLVATGTLNLPVDNASTLKSSVPIPNDLKIGQTYWLGVIIDRTNAISENDEFNATYMPIQVF